ncbi:MAG: DEAD/DEAH box helicase family protein [Candidatus Micrarchaeia archaeon]
MVLKQVLEPRKYQKEIAEAVIRNGNTLVVLPTGLGKTLIAILVADKIIERSSVLFLAPTKPLVNQHAKTISELLDKKVIAITGEINKRDRVGLWGEHAIIVATPQTVLSDIDYIKKEMFGLVVFDEVHRAVGNYAYAHLAQVFRPHALMLGLTASPSGKQAKIDEIKQVLGISHVESRTYTDADVAPYVKEMDIDWVLVEESEVYKHAKEKLRELIKWYIHMVNGYGFRVFGSSRKRMIESKNAIAKSRIKSKYLALKYLSAAINLDYALEMLETQSMDAFLKYVENFGERETKGTKLLMKDGRLEEIVNWVKLNKVIHPKMEKLISILQSDANAKYIVFSQYTAQIEYLEKILNTYGFNAKMFIGQRKGFTRKQQLETIEQFRKGEFNILVASSIGEEGLDIPSVDYVVFYEPIPSEIRSIQRRGRAGRAKKGYVKILITKGTRDEAYLFSAKNKERSMKRIVKRMSTKSTPMRRTGTLTDFM